MKTTFQRIVMMITLALLLNPVAIPQPGSKVQAVKDSLSGQRLLVTYRQGGPVYGTFFILQVHLCRSGNYVTFGQSRKQTVLGNEQVSNWKERGRWDVGVVAGQVGVQYVSSSGQANFVPVRVMPDGSIQTGNGTSVVRQGSAQCP